MLRLFCRWFGHDWGLYPFTTDPDAAWLRCRRCGARRRLLDEE